MIVILVLLLVAIGELAEAAALMWAIPHVQLVLPAVPVMAPGYGDCLKFTLIVSAALLPVYLLSGLIKGLFDD